MGVETKRPLSHPKGVSGSCARGAEPIAGHGLLAAALLYTQISKYVYIYAKIYIYIYMYVYTYSARGAASLNTGSDLDDLATLAAKFELKGAFPRA